MTLTCKLPEAWAVRLDALAKEQRCSKSAILREALEARLAAKDGVKQVTAFDLVGHLYGALPGGPSDLSTNPEHMRGFGE